mmetsp:Transcript_27575/g.31745  ORF Transcript_27575/g.31745 Transcript_27575/m.31745 type:complete len:212 (-) Transcript_27575:1078-1713(-)
MSSDEEEGLGFLDILPAADKETKHTEEEKVRHKGKKDVVCYHWYKKNLCQKGDECEFLHEYIAEKLPVCKFFSNSGSCNNKNCDFRHDVQIDQSRRECPLYARGYCHKGPDCRDEHIKKDLCVNYYYGFCVKGDRCTEAHPKPFTDQELLRIGLVTQDSLDKHKEAERHQDSQMRPTCPTCQGRFPHPPGTPCPMMMYPGMPYGRMMRPGM